MPLLLEKSLEVFNDYSRVILLSGARKAGKTLNGLTNKLVRHAFENNGAMVGIVGKTIRNVTGGLWRDLISFCIPGWEDAKIGLQVTVTPRMTGDSHMRFFRIRNMHGTESEFQLYSLDNEAEVESKFKSLRFSCIAISEIDQFRSRNMLDILMDQLRLPSIPREDHQLLADCNPPAEGTDHWTYRAMVSGTGEERIPGSKTYHFFLDENWLMDEADRAELKAKYKYDPIKYARFVDSKWVKDTTSAFFDGYFMPNIHIIGDKPTPRMEDWEVLTPQPESTCLITGTDFGDVNHAATFLSSRINEEGEVVFDIFDELVSVGRPMSLRQFGQEMWIKIEKWNQWFLDQGRKPPHWRHWTDSSAMKYRASSDDTDARIIYQVTKGNVVMHAASKGAGSIMNRVNLVKRLFHENRLFISISCPETISWATFLRPSGTLRPGGSKRYVIATDLECKHAFDAATYAISQELPIEVRRSSLPHIQKSEPVIV